MSWYLFSIINGYVARQAMAWLFVTIGGILSTVCLFEAIELIRRSVSLNGLPISILMEMVFLRIPEHLNTLFPFIIFFSTALCLWRLNQTNEIIAIKTLGVSIWWFVLGVCGTYACVGIFNLIVLNPLGSAMTQRFAKLEETYFKNKPTYRLSVSSNGMWFKESTKDISTIMVAKSFDLSRSLFFDVTFYDFDHQGQYKGRVDAQEAILDNGYWQLKKVRTWDQNHEAKALDISKRETDLTSKKLKNSQADPKSLSFWETPNFITILEKAGLSSIAYKIYWHAQIAQIGSIIAMVLLACNLCLRPLRYKPIVRYMLFGLVLCFAINFLNDVIYALGLAERIPILLAVWFLPLITAMLSVTFLIHYEDYV